MAAAYSVSLVCIALVCIFGVLNSRYQDTLGQRIGMGIACIGAIAELYALHAGVCRVNASTVFASGVAVFALSTCWKKWRMAHRSQISAGRSA